MDLFTPEYKRFKARRPLPDFSDVIDINDVETQTSKHNIVKIKLEETDVTPVCGFKPCNEWEVFRFPDFPGYIVIRNPFLDGYQRYWVSRCLKDFSADERNSTNLTNLGHFDYFDVWDDFVSSESTTFTKEDPLWKLRWVTLGYHYGWNTKEYSEDRKAEFPADVQCLSQYFSHCLGYGPFRAEAGIVNYYHLDSTLGGHTDHSEIDHTAPLLSFSFGQTCVFLLGGSTKETKPMALYLHSGDVCVMSKEARLAYHAVPKILTPKDSHQVPTSFSIANENFHVNNKDCHTQTSHSTATLECVQEQDYKKLTNSTLIDSDGHLKIDGDSQHSDTKICNDGRNKQSVWISEEYATHIDNLNEDIQQVISELDWKPYEIFLKSSRINLNLRQVLPPGCEVVEPKDKETFDIEPY